MSDQDATTPRVFIARHSESSRKFRLKASIDTSIHDLGETEWTINGRYTGITELELTEHGERQVPGTSKLLVGPGKLIDSSQLAHIFISPRKRARKTYELLFGTSAIDNDRVSVTEEMSKWGYGNYEGLLTKEIEARRSKKGLDKERPWDIWKDGCEGGEYVSRHWSLASKFSVSNRATRSS